MPVYYNKGRYERPEQRPDEVMWVCPKCKHKNPTDVGFCLLCFSKQPDKSSEKEYGQQDK